MSGPMMGGGGRMGRMARDEMSPNASRRFTKATLPKRVLLARFWKYLGRNRALMLLAMAQCR